MTKAIVNPTESLFIAAADGDLQAAQYALQQGANVNAQDDEGEDTPLHGACSEGHLEIVKLLVSKGANTSVQDEDGRTPLHCACAYNHLDIVAFLVHTNAGAYTDTKNNLGALNIACRGGNREMVKILLESKKTTITQELLDWANNLPNATPNIAAIQQLLKEKSATQA